MKPLSFWQKTLAVILGMLVPTVVVAEGISLLKSNGDQEALRGEGGAAFVKLTTRNADGGVLPPQQVQVVSKDGGQALTQPNTWNVDSSACLSVCVNSAGADGGRLAAVDGGVPEALKLYRCVAPSSNVGDLCYRQNGVFIASCAGSSLAAQIVPGAELYTTLVYPVTAQSSSGAACMSCCPIIFN